MYVCMYAYVLFYIYYFRSYWGMAKGYWRTMTFITSLGAIVCDILKMHCMCMVEGQAILHLGKDYTR